jgi:8-oxo-dGTP pyrophosphatase MutT (NUDIX family)
LSQIPPGLAGMIHEGPPVKPRSAATVLLVRGGEPWEVLMLRRPGGADFAPGAHVFPGGSVHAEDRLLGDPLRGAAVRELFEELGILLAKGPRGFASEADAERIRLRISHGVNFPTALKEGHLEPALEELAYFSRWVTPEQLRRRFDTRFYLARLPEGQDVHPQPGEVEAWSWVTAEKALRDPGFTMVFATRRVLEMVAVDPSADSLLDRYRSRRRVPVTRPVVRVTDGRFEVVTESLPGIPRARGRRRG